jgi:RNA polymerase sigma-70 factor, ECF subfamily
MKWSDSNSKHLRTNSEWIAGLSSKDESTIADLSSFLCKGLTTGLKGKVDENLAEDFAQDAILKVLSGIDSYRGDCLFTTWAMAIAMRVAFSELRRARWKDVSLNAFTEQSGFADLPTRSASPEKTLALDQLVAKLRNLIDTILSERQRELIRAELEGFPQAVLCERLQTNRNALYKLGHDARLKLKNALLADGFSEVEVRCVLAEASNQ